MSYSISTLLTRNLHDVFGENDPARRRAAIEDCVFYDPKGGVYRGRDEIDGYRAALARRRLTPVLISSSRGTAAVYLFFDKL
jgi:hypothetical protein